MATRVVRQANYVLQPGDDLLLCDATAQSITITLSPLVPPQYLRRVEVRKCDRNILTSVTIRRADGSTVQTLTAPHQAARLGNTGLDWTDESALRGLPSRWPWG